MFATLLLLAVVGYLTYYYWSTRKGPNAAPGPWLRFPFIGHGHVLFKGQIDGHMKLKKEFGGIYEMFLGPTKSIFVADLATSQDMLSKDIFSGRFNVDQELKSDLGKWMKGGHGMHGLIGSTGPEWKEQRRFALRHLKDFGFGKASMGDLIQEEWDDLSEVLKGHHRKGEEVDLSHLFNLTALNVLWRIVAGKRFDMNDSLQKQRLHDLAEMFASFGVANVGVLLSMFLPLPLQKISPMMKPIKRIYSNLFKMFEDEYNDHEKTYDPNSMRDFIDVYMSERKRANEAGDRGSSFYGQAGHWNFLNGMFDLFLAGSETTSTSMVFFVLYMLHNPTIQKELRAEVDSVVGRERKPTLDDRDNMPKILAFITEVHRHATVAPFGVQHANSEATEYKGIPFPANTMIVSCLSTIMQDPENFEEPKKFKPERFIDQETGQYKPHPAMCQYGIGKRECPGKSLAKNEQFLFLTNLLQTFDLEPSATEELPSVWDANISVTRVPKAFKARFFPRE